MPLSAVSGVVSYAGGEKPKIFACGMSERERQQPLRTNPQNSTGPQTDEGGGLLRCLELLGFGVSGLWGLGFGAVLRAKWKACCKRVWSEILSGTSCRELPDPYQRSFTRTVETVLNFASPCILFAQEPARGCRFGTSFPAFFLRRCLAVPLECLSPPKSCKV